MNEELKDGLIIAGAGGGGCFRKGTQIQLEHGKTIAIEDLKQGDEILAFDEQGDIHVAKVTVLHYHADPQPIWRVKFWRGETCITPNHWVLNQYGNFVEMGKLTTHDALVDGMGHLRPIIDAEFVGNEPVYNLTVETHHTFIADGIRVHNGGHRERFPVVAGAGGGGGGGKGGGGSARAAVEDPDSLQSRAMVGLVDLIGEGQIGGLVNGAKSIFFNNTPLENADGSRNFSGVTWDFRDGQQTQEPITGFSDVETPNVVNVKVTSIQPNVTTITNPNADAVRMLMLVPSLYYQDKTTGDVHGSSVRYKFQVSTNGGQYVDVPGTSSDWMWVAGTASVVQAGNLRTITAAAGASKAKAVLRVSTTKTGSVTIRYRKGYGTWYEDWQSVTYTQNDAGAIANAGAKYTWDELVIEGGESHTIIQVENLSNPDGFIVELLSASSWMVASFFELSGKTRSRYQRSHQFDLPKPGNTWNIRTIRLSEDSTSGALSNDLWVDTAVEIVNSKLTYPNSALIGITIDSSQFNSIPSRSYLVDGLYIRVPSNYNPQTRAYTGIWNGTFKVAISNNPAWVLYDVLTSSRYGLGNYINASLIDKAKLYQIGKYCDELVPDGFGGYEPRFAINTSIQTQTEAFRLITDLCSAFNGMSYWTGGMVGFTQDSPTDASMIYSQSNVIDGVFQYQGSARKDRHSVVLVRWNDSTQNYKQAIEYVEDADLVAKYGVRKFETVAFGCTSRGQANRVGRWILYTEQYQSNLIQFSVGVDSALALPGEVVKIHDTTRAGKRMGGRLKSCTLTSAVLDAPITLSGEVATISIRMQDGTFVERTLQQSGVTTDTVTWGVPLPSLPVAYAIWLISDSTLEPIYARIVGIGQGENPGEFAITCLEHNPSKYDAIEKGLKLVTANTSIIDPNYIEAPSDLTVNEAPYQVAPGVAGISVDLSWYGKGASYEVTWKRDGAYPTNWVTVTTSNPLVTLDNVRAGVYTFKVVALNGFGVRSSEVVAIYQTVGKAAAPGDVANFTVNKRTNDLLLTWDQVTDINVLGYEVRVGASWDSGEVITTRFAGTMITHDQSAAGTYFYHIRSINADGVYSDNVSTYKLVLTAPSTPQHFDIVQSGTRLELNWTPNSEPDLAYYEIREGNAWSSATLVTQVKATTFTIPSGGIGSRKFWIKSVASPGIYCEIAAWVSADIAMPTNSNIVASFDEAALGWPGNKLNMYFIGTDLMMNPTVKRSEYIFPVDLLDSYRAQNSVYATFESIVSDTDSIKWMSSTFDWNDPEAARHWAPGGDVDSVTAKYQISRKVGLMPLELDGFPLNGTTTSVKGINATTTTGAAYENGRFQTGMRIKGGTRVDWQSITIPEVFRYSAWIIPKNVSFSSEFEIIELANATDFLRLGYNEPTGEFRLVDKSGNTLTVPLTIAASDTIGIAIVQTDTTRKLFVAKIGETPAYDQDSFAPIGAISKLRLYWT